MDTRTKIVAEARAIEIASGFTAITGTFDVLLASHVRALRQIAEGGVRVVVIVLDRPGSLLPQVARAELVAALAMVDMVVAPGRNVPELLLKMEPAEIVSFEQDDIRRTAELVEHVHQRQRA